MAEKYTKITVHAPEVSMSPSAMEVLNFIEYYGVKYEGIPEADTSDLQLSIISFFVDH